MRFLFQTLLLACSLLWVPSQVAAGESMTLDAVKTAFNNTKVFENAVCILHDGWHIAFISHNGKEINAAIIIEQKNTDDHEHNLSETVSRVAELVGMDSPESMDFEESETDCSLLVNQSVISDLGDDANHVFDGSPLAAMAYLLKEEYFCIHSIQPNGFIHWKTIKKSGVDILMPMAGNKLGAIEVTGRQQMNEYAAEVLADKLGLGKNNVPGASRAALCPQLRCTMVPYMNSKSNVLLARTDRRAVIGKRQAVAQLLTNRNEGALSYPSKASDWPEVETEEEVEEETEKEPEAPAQKAEPPRLTPEAAREAYIKLIQAL